MWAMVCVGGKRRTLNINLYPSPCFGLLLFIAGFDFPVPTTLNIRTLWLQTWTAYCACFMRVLGFLAQVLALVLYPLNHLPNPSNASYKWSDEYIFLSSIHVCRLRTKGMWIPSTGLSLHTEFVWRVGDSWVTSLWPPCRSVLLNIWRLGQQLLSCFVSGKEQHSESLAGANAFSGKKCSIISYSIN